MPQKLKEKKRCKAGKYFKRKQSLAQRELNDFYRNVPDVTELIKLGRIPRTLILMGPCDSKQGVINRNRSLTEGN